MIYLDSCILIYAVEDESARGDAVRQTLATTTQPVAISPLVVLECMVGPLKNDDLALEDHFTRVFANCEIIGLGMPEFLRAAHLRSRHSLRTPDALHLAAAQLSGCEELWTNDARLATASRGMAIDVLAL